jgi:hypothetical protein
LLVLRFDAGNSQNNIDHRQGVWVLLHITHLTFIKWSTLIFNGESFLGAGTIVLFLSITLDGCADYWMGRV